MIDVARSPAATGRRPNEDAVVAALARAEGDVVHAGPCRWHLTDVCKRRAPALVTLEGDWLLVARPVGGAKLTRLTHTSEWVGWRALDARMALPEGVRPVIADKDSRLWIQGERPLSRSGANDPDRLARWIQAAARADAAIEKSVPDVARPEPNAKTAQECPESQHLELAALCEAGGWTVTQQGGAAATVIELRARDSDVCYAAVFNEGAGARVRLSLTSADDAAANSACRVAAALALLRVAASVRMVRASATCDEDALGAALEVGLDPPVDETLMSHALSALAVAHQQISNELEVLANDAAIARAYLHAQGVQ